MGIFQSKRQCSVVCIGLDNSGKSTIVNKLKPSESKIVKKCITYIMITMRNTCTLIQQTIQLIPHEAQSIFKKVEDIQATVGFSKEQFSFGNIDFLVADMAGSQRFRNLWEQYYSEVQGIIFVVDSSDDFRMVSVKYELELLLANKSIQSKPEIPILFFANKMDLPKSLTSADLSERLDLPTLISSRPFNIVRSNALAGAGLDEGIKWLSDHLPAAQNSS